MQVKKPLFMKGQEAIAHGTRRRAGMPRARRESRSGVRAWDALLYRLGRMVVSALTLTVS